jgi:Fe-S cluster assembly protein SufB
LRRQLCLRRGVWATHATIDDISDAKGEEPWLRAFRDEALDIFFSRDLPKWFSHGDVLDMDFSKIRYYLAHSKEVRRTWDDVPGEIRETFERLGVPENERKFLGGVEAQFDSEAAYSKMKDALLERGVIFVDSSAGLGEYSHILKKNFATVVPIADNKFSTLNSAVFSGESFIYVPAGVKVE